MTSLPHVLSDAPCQYQLPIQVALDLTCIGNVMVHPDKLYVLLLVILQPHIVSTN